LLVLVSFLTHVGFLSEALKSNASLEELDISGHSLGENAFLKFCVALRDNKTLKALKCDQNKCVTKVV